MNRNKIKKMRIITFSNLGLQSLQTIVYVLTLEKFDLGW